MYVCGSLQGEYYDSVRLGLFLSLKQKLSQHCNEGKVHLDFFLMP